MHDVRSVSHHLRRRIPERGRRYAAYSAAALATLFAIWLARPDLVLSPDAPPWSDLGGHLVALRHLIEVSLPAGHLLDWSHEWYGGYPSFYFYFPLPSLCIAVLTLLIPLNVSGKVFALVAPALLPWAGYLLVRGLDFSRWHASVGALGTVALLASTDQQVFGGNVLSSLIGEYSYAAGLAAALYYVAQVGRVRNGEGRIVALTLSLCVTALSHLIPTIFAVAASASALGRSRARRQILLSWVWAFALAGFWAVPFIVRSAYMGEIAWRYDPSLLAVLPLPILLLLPWVIAAPLALRRDANRLLPIAFLGGAALLGYLIPHGVFGQARSLPIFHLCIYLGTALGIAAGLEHAFRNERRLRLAAWGLGLVMLGAVSIAQSEVVRARGARLLVSSTPDAAAYAALGSALQALPRTGMVHWEYLPQNERLLGGRMPLVRLTALYPGVRTTQGLLSESAHMAPLFRYLLGTLNWTGYEERHWRHPLPIHRDSTLTMAQMRALGTGYFVTFTDPGARWAAAQRGALRRVATHPSWTIWAVNGAAIVEPVRQVAHIPLRPGRDLAARWLRSPDRDGTVLALDSLPFANLPVHSAGAVESTTLAHRRVRFRTTAPGTPHLVRVAYFPNWKASGATGPWRSASGFMLVVPEQSDVILNFERTWVEWLGAGLTLAAFCALLVHGIQHALRKKTTRAGDAAIAISTGPSSK